MSHSSELPRPQFFQTTLGRWVGFLFLLSIFFPFIRTSPLDTDVQPAALLLSLLVIIGVRDRKLPLPIALLAIPAFFSFIVVWIGGFDLVAFRSVGNYCSLFFISAAAYYLLRDSSRFSPKFLLLVVLVWFSVGFIQSFFARNFLVEILPRATTTTNRGVVGLAPEPTFYGIACIFFLLFSLTEKKYRWILSILLLSQIVVFARSSMSILFLLLFVGFYFIFSLSMKLLTIAGGGVALAVYIALTYFEKTVKTSRFYDLVLLALQSPLLILTKDASGNERFLHIYFSVLGFFENYMLPAGFGTFSKYVGSKVADYHEIIVSLNRSNRIMSGYGSALFEMGFLGLAIPIAISWVIWRHFENDLRMRLTLIFFINLILFSAIQLAFPPLAFLIAYWCVKKKPKVQAG